MNLSLFLTYIKQKYDICMLVILHGNSTFWDQYTQFIVYENMISKNSKVSGKK